MTRDEADERIRSFFGRHAVHYGRSRSHRAGADLERLVSALAPAPAHRCLDVATGGGRALREMARVLAPGGRVGIADMTVPENDEVARLLNALERARDSSHRRALSAAEWADLAGRAGLEVVTADTLLERVPWETWLAPVATGGAEEARAVEILAAASPEVRAGATEDGPGGRLFLKRRVLLVARKPAG